MKKNLVIVESPAKAKTISKFLGPDYEVTSSFGHIRDLPSKGMSIDVENNFEPQYEVSPDKTKVVAALRKSAKTAEMVWLASDEDREGEAIAWHLSQALKLDPKKTKRIVFHEITKSAILHSIENPRDVDVQLVDAQQARRVLDRLVGYELSPVLWKKVQRGLSAGRVQSVAVRLIVEREREITAHESEATYKVTATFVTKGKETLSAELTKKLSDKPSAQKLLESLINATFQIDSLEKKPGTRNPSTPLTTSTLQQEASRRLGFSVRQTMSVAQKLYEAGHITYMRTDSLNLSETALKGAEDEIIQRFGADQHQRRQFKTKSAGAQEAHEAIRPTHFGSDTAGADEQQKKLYKLIWRRTLASQMIPAKVEKTVISITDSKKQATFTAKGEILTHPGWLALYPKDKKDLLLPDVSEGESLTADDITATQVYSRPPARYTEASLVKKLEEMGIGRPSTYAPTISTIQDRGYIEKSDLEGTKRSVEKLVLAKGKITATTDEETTGADKNKLIPTAIAGVVTDFLSKFFTDIVDYDFTANVEKQFDHIADGKIVWQTMIKDFYGEFHKKVVDAEGIDRKDAGGMKKIGIDPKSKKPVFARVGRFGPMVQIGEASDEEKPKFAPMPAGKTMETVELSEALEMFNLPRNVGTTKAGEEIIANIGRFGPYVKFGSTFVSIKPEDPFTITEAKALEFIAAKLEADANKFIKIFEKEGIQVINGRYGPYITDGTKNAKIPKDVEPAKLTLKKCQELLAAAPDKKRGRRSAKK